MNWVQMKADKAAYQLCKILRVGDVLLLTIALIIRTTGKWLLSAMGKKVPNHCIALSNLPHTVTDTTVNQLVEQVSKL